MSYSVGSIHFMGPDEAQSGQWPSPPPPSPVSGSWRLYVSVCGVIEDTWHCADRHSRRPLHHPNEKLDSECDKSDRISRPTTRWQVFPLHGEYVKPWLGGEKGLWHKHCQYWAGLFRRLWKEPAWDRKLKPGLQTFSLRRFYPVHFTSFRAWAFYLGNTPRFFFSLGGGGLCGLVKIKPPVWESGKIKWI